MIRLGLYRVHISQSERIHRGPPSSRVQTTASPVYNTKSYPISPNGFVSIIYMLFMHTCASHTFSASVARSLPALTVLSRRTLLPKMVTTAASFTTHGDRSEIVQSPAPSPAPTHSISAEPTLIASNIVAAASICPSPKRQRSAIDFEAMPHFPASAAVVQPAVSASPKHHLDLALKSVVKVYTTTAS